MTTHRTRPEARKPTGNAADWRRNFERYTALAQSAGRDEDPVTRENYYQHAEHYLRLMNGASQA